MKQKTLFLILAISLIGLGCAKEKKTTAAAPTAPHVTVPTGPYVPPTVGPGYDPGSNFQYGGTAVLTIDGGDIYQRNQRLQQYTGRPMNNPINIVVNANLVQYGDRYGGNITVAYTDNGITHHGYFTGGNSQQLAAYNVWYSNTGKNAFHGFFEDFYGGLVFVIDGKDSSGLGDGTPADTVKVKGSVWFKNFGLTYAPHPPTHCWFVSLGPYDCRAWPNGDGVNFFTTLEPDNGYTRLGTFTGLPLNKAFNGSVNDI